MASDINWFTRLDVPYESINVSTAADGSIYIATNTKGFGWSGDYYVHKINQSGLVEWTKLLAKSTWGGEFLLSTDGSAYVFTYTYEETGKELVELRKYDNNWNSLWSDTKNASGIAEVKDGLILSGTDDTGGLLTKITVNGREIRRQAIDPGQWHHYSIASSIDGSVYIVGGTLQPEYSSISRYTQDLSKIWSTKLDKADLYYDAAVSPSGGIYVLGASGGNDTFISKINSDGVELARKKIQGLQSIAISATGQVIIAGIEESNGHSYIASYNPRHWMSGLLEPLRFDITSKAIDVISILLGSSNSDLPQLMLLKEPTYIEIATSTWQAKVKIKSVGQAPNNGGDRVDATQIEFGAGAQGSVLNGGSRNDTLWGRAGWDIIDGGEGDDLIRGGNGRDIITGGLGRDELHGDFGWNTFKSEKDGFSDLIVVKSDQWLSNWLLGGAGNNADGSKCDIIEGLDAIDKIKILGVTTDDLTFQAGVAAQGTSGIGIYAKGALEALYTGGDLSVDQLRRMTTGDTNLSALEATGLYGVW